MRQKSFALLLIFGAPAAGRLVRGPLARACAGEPPAHQPAGSRRSDD